MKKGFIGYTTDNKKVIVNNVLDKNNCMVQQLFVEKNKPDGKEIPGGPQWIHTGPLFDNPVETYHDKYMRENKENNDKRLRSNEEDYNRQRKYLDNQKELTREWANNLKRTRDQFDQSVLTYIRDVLTGKFKFIVSLGYSAKIHPIDYLYQRNEYGMCLISLFGREDGKVTARMNQYSDGSGSWTTYVPCKTYKEALNKLEEYLNKGEKLNDSDVQVAFEYKIKLPADKLKAYYEKKQSEVSVSIESQIKTLNQSKKKLSSLNRKIKSL